MGLSETVRGFRGIITCVIHFRQLDNTNYHNGLHGGIVLVVVGAQLSVKYVCLKESTEKNTSRMKAEPTMVLRIWCVWV